MNRFAKYISAVMVAFLIGSSVGFASWINVKNDIHVTDTVEKSPKKAICYNDKTNVKYTDLKKAVDSAQNNENIYVIPGSKFEVSETITIPKGKNLYIPFEDKRCSVTVDEFKGYKYMDYSFTTIADSDQSKVDRNLVSSITLKDNVSINVYGGLYLGAEIGTYGVTRKYSQILLSPGSKIFCETGSTFDCFGYVKEINGKYNPTNDDDKNNRVKMDNSNDPGRLVHARGGSHITIVASIYDMKSGSGLKALVDNNICPFSEISLTNIQTYLKVDYSANIDGIGVISMGKFKPTDPNHPEQGGEPGMVFMPRINLIRIWKDSDSTAGLFYFRNNTTGYFGLEYIPANPKYTSMYNDSLNVFCNGDIRQGFMKISIDIGVPINIDTSAYFLPLNHRFKIYIASGAKYSTQYKVKLLNGAYLKIMNGGTFTLEHYDGFFGAGARSGEFIVYDKQTTQIVPDAGYFAKLEDASFINNGKFYIDDVGSKFGGNIKTDDGLGSSCSIKIPKGMSWTHLYPTSYEGTNNYSITIPATTTFIDSNGNQSSKQILSFADNYPGGRKENDVIYTKSSTDSTAYVKNTNHLSKISTYKVNKLHSGNPNETIAYDLYGCLVDDGSGQVKISPKRMDDGYTFTLPSKYFAKVNVALGLGTFVGGSDTFRAGTYFSMNNSRELNLTAVFTMNVQFKTWSNSGAGGTKFEYWIYDSQSGGSQITSGSFDNGKGLLKIQENYWMEFKITIGIHNFLNTAEKCIIKSITIDDVESIGSFTIKGSGTVISAQNAKYNGRIHLVPKDETKTITIMVSCKYTKGNGEVVIP